MYYDFRSDTVTKPTPKMREAMYHAEVGDDVYGDDPTVRQLEKLAAEKLGKEAALFVPSGTFGNQLALFTHCARGTEVIVGEDNHIFYHEVGAASVIAGVQLRTIPTTNGYMDPDAVLGAIRDEDIHYPETSLLCVENAHSTGAVVPMTNMRELYALAKERNIPVHLDGARLFNAAATLEVDVSEICAYADSIMFCLSKGLAAPVGSMLVGEADFIERARKKRKLMGGGLRQAGVLAAAGIIAIEEMSHRLYEDHRLAKELAEGLEQIPGITVLRDRLDINMVFFKIEEDRIDEEDLLRGLKERNLLVNGMEDGLYRFVVNKDTPADAVEKLIKTMTTLVRPE